MNYSQLVAPDTSVTGRIGFCLEYAAKVFHCTQGAPFAWTAWGQTQQHTEPPPNDVAYPLWFSYFVQTVNQGHVVIFVPGQGYYSSPWQVGTTHAVLPSISEVERIYKVKYVGWSPDILGKQVIQGGAMTDRDTVNRLLLAYFTPDDMALAGEAYVQGLVGRDTNSVVQILTDSPQFAAKRIAAEGALEYQKTHPNVAQATKLGPGVYVV